MSQQGSGEKLINKQKNLTKALTDRIKKLRLCVAQHGYCEAEFKEIMTDIMSNVFSKGRTKVILQKDDIVKSMLNYCVKKSSSQQSLVCQLLGEIEEKISHLCESPQKQVVETIERSQKQSAMEVKVLKQGLSQKQQPLMNNQQIDDDVQLIRRNNLAQKRRQLREFKMIYM